MWYFKDNIYLDFKKEEKWQDVKRKEKGLSKKKVLPFFLQKGRKKFFFFLVMAYRQNDDFFAVPQEIKIYFVRLKILNKRIYQRIYIFLLNNLFLLSSFFFARKQKTLHLPQTALSQKWMLLWWFLWFLLSFSVLIWLCIKS